MSFMKQAIYLAKKGMGSVSPNPMVGAVLVKMGKIIGQGYHQKFGGAHAEVNVLEAAGDRSKGAALYVNLEPCAHFGKTPACVDKIIQSGVREVHMAMFDPNPKVNGKGKQLLENAGIKVIVGECGEEAKKLNEAFVTWVIKGRPFVIAKYAMSLDGKIATRNGDSKWISGNRSRRFVHVIRSCVDAIVVGVETVIKDDPQLIVRYGNKCMQQPIRIVLDTRGRTPLSAKVISGKTKGKTMIIVGEKIQLKKKKAFENCGVEVISLSCDNYGIDLKELMGVLSRCNIASVLVEGGGRMFASFFNAGLVDKVFAFVAPKIIGGDGAITPVEGVGVSSVSQAIHLTDVKIRKSGSDVMFVAYTDFDTKRKNI